jgi:hypothetical protein
VGGTLWDTQTHRWPQAARGTGPRSVITMIGFDMCNGPLGFQENIQMMFFRFHRTPNLHLNPVWVKVEVGGPVEERRPNTQHVACTTTLYIWHCHSKSTRLIHNGSGPWGSGRQAFLRPSFPLATSGRHSCFAVYTTWTGQVGERFPWVCVPRMGHHTDNAKSRSRSSRRTQVRPYTR